MSEVVKLERHDVIAIVTVDSPPVNALSAAVRGGIFECMKSAIADAEVKAIVLTCGGRTFIAGADITEFGKPPKPPGLAEVLALMENSPKPIIAAIHGTALGGGLEVALACHYRVATKEARLGLPEVKLGLLPGAGGTQRLPRAVGPELAVKMIVGGDPISAAEAQKSGLIEEIVEGPASGGEAFARKVLAEKRPLRKLRDDDSKLAAAKADISIFTNAVAALTKKARGLEAPFAAADAVRAAIDLPFDEGLEEGARRVPQAGVERPVQGAALRLLLRARSCQDRRSSGGNEGASGRRASPSSAPAPWAAVSRCRSPMPVFRSR